MSSHHNQFDSATDMRQPPTYRKRNIVFHLGRDGLKPVQVLHQSQHVIAQPHTTVGVIIFPAWVVLGADDDSQRHYVHDIVQFMFVFRFHLVPQRVNFLRSSKNLHVGGLLSKRRVVVESPLQKILRSVERFPKLLVVLS